jgi:trans-aconitate methyltransferase
MKTLEQFIATLTPMQILRVGQVVTAHETRAWFRARHKVTEADFKEAEKNRRGWPVAEVGDYYDALASEHERVKWHAGSTAVSMDKFYKKMKHQLVDAGCTEAQVEELVAILANQPKEPA